MPKPGARARKVAKELRWSLIKKNWRLLLVVALSALFLAAGVVGLLVIALGMTIAAFFAGAVLTGIGWFVWELVETQSGARTWAAGALGEDLTAGALKKVRKHELVHGLKFHGFDVDHVMVGPSGVWAVETKWTSRDLDLSLGTRERRIIRDLGAAKRGAGQIVRFLRLAHDVQVEVHPLLVVWGSGVRDIDGGLVELEGVRVLVGRQAKRWRATTFNAAGLGDEERWSALKALHFQERRQI